MRSKTLRLFVATGLAAVCAIALWHTPPTNEARLLLTNHRGCTIFAAVSGSSAATCATIGKMTLPELGKRGYPEELTIGSLAGSGTLGLLIPPSIILIVYGVSAEVSIADLFIAGVLPGILLAALFSGYIALWAMSHPGLIPPADPPMSLREKLQESGLEKVYYPYLRQSMEVGGG